MTYNIFSDPLLYINYCSAAVGIYLLWRFGKRLQSLDLEKSKAEFIITFAFLVLTVGSCLYITQRAGDIQIEKMIKAYEAGKK